MTHVHVFPFSRYVSFVVRRTHHRNARPGQIEAQDALDIQTKGPGAYQAALAPSREAAATAQTSWNLQVRKQNHPGALDHPEKGQHRKHIDSQIRKCRRVHVRERPGIGAARSDAASQTNEAARHSCRSQRGNAPAPSEAFPGDTSEGVTGDRSRQLDRASGQSRDSLRDNDETPRANAAMSTTFERETQTI